jgi:signal transduction histidine kinase
LPTGGLLKTAALDAGVPLRDVQEAASHADPRTTMRYDPARGSGLVGVKDRVEALDGVTSVHSPLGAGTSVKVELPLEPVL